MEFEDVLLDVGDGGRYQKGLILLFLIPSAVLLPWYTMNIMFMISVPDHWCYVPEVALSNLTIEQQRALVSPPADAKCSMFDVNYTELLMHGVYQVPNGTATKRCDRGWQYDKTYYESTAASEWNMVCKDDHYTSLVLTLFNVGSIIGTPIYGFLADKIGRRPTYYIVLSVTVLTSFASCLTRNFIAFLVIKTINGGLMPSLFQTPFIIVLELVAPELRTHMNGLVNLAWTVGLAALPLVAYLTRDWVTFGLITSSVLVPLFLYWPYLPESPRWLISQEKYDEATKALVKIAKTNKQLVDKKEVAAKLKILGDKMKKEQEEMNGVSSLDLLRYPRLRMIFFIISWCWVADVMAYYGLQINVSNLAGNEFINFFLTSIAEIPGYILAWITMDKWGRRWPCVVGFFFTGIVCMLPAVVAGLPYADITASMLGKFFSSFTFLATYQQGSELYPTVLRSMGLGMSSTVSMTVSLATPYIVYLAVYSKALPFLIIGFVSLSASVAASFLPETLNENLPQTINDTEHFGKKQKYFSMNRRKASMSRERAASLALQLKGLEAMGIAVDGKLKRSSKVLKNSDFGPHDHQVTTASVNHEQREKTPDRKSEHSYQEPSEKVNHAYDNSSFDGQTTDSKNNVRV